MITYFRKIRQGILGTANARRYLLYAIGEIALVVIGILIALQINNWNHKRLDRIRAVEYHQRLIEDLNFIIERNESINKNAMEVMNSITQTIEILDKGKIENEGEKRVFDYTMVIFSRLSRQISYIPTWEEMQSNGDMNLIYNIELRKDINALQGYINLAHEIFSKHATTIRNDLTVYSRYMRTFVDSTTLEVNVVSDFGAMAADPQFINQFSSNISSWRTLATFAKSTTNRAADLKVQLESELETMTQ